MARVRSVILRLQEEDCKWMEEAYGGDWTRRLQQHIMCEVALRRQDGLPMTERPLDSYAVDVVDYGITLIQGG